MSHCRWQHHWHKLTPETGKQDSTTVTVNVAVLVEMAAAHLNTVADPSHTLHCTAEGQLPHTPAGTHCVAGTPPAARGVAQCDPGWPRLDGTHSWGWDSWVEEVVQGFGPGAYQEGGNWGSWALRRACRQVQPQRRALLGCSREHCRLGCEAQLGALPVVPSKLFSPAAMHKTCFLNAEQRPSVTRGVPQLLVPSPRELGGTTPTTGHFWPIRHHNAAPEGTMPQDSAS